MNFDAVIFDCDGVLVASEKLSSALEIKMLTDLGYSVTQEELIAACFGRSPHQVSWANHSACSQRQNACPRTES